MGCNQSLVSLKITKQKLFEQGLLSLNMFKLQQVLGPPRKIVCFPHRHLLLPAFCLPGVAKSSTAWVKDHGFDMEPEESTDLFPVCRTFRSRFQLGKE